jgi:hypothetical protein
MRRASASVVFACPAGRVRRKYPDMKPAGRFDLHMSNAPQGAPIGRIVWPAPAGFNPGLDPKPRHPAGTRLSDLCRWGYACRHATLVGCSAAISLSTCFPHVGLRGSGISIGVARVSVGLACPASDRFTRPQGFGAAGGASTPLLVPQQAARRNPMDSHPVV